MKTICSRRLKEVCRNKYAKRFGIAVWIGILADWVLGIPVIFFPQAVLNLLGFRPTVDPVWTAFAGLLVVLLSLFYIPGALNPYRYRFNAWLAVFARPPGVIFFFLLNPGYYPAFGILDGVLFMIQYPLLLLAMRETPRESRIYESPETLAPQVKVGDRSALWLKRAIWIGIIQDWVLGIPTIFAPEKVLSMVGQRQTLDPVWTSFAALLLVLLGLFYAPGANQPYRYRANAWLAVFARPPGVIFFLFIWPAFYALFAAIDAFMFLIQIPFLILTMQLIPERRLHDDDVFEYRGNTFRNVKEAAFEGEYNELPYHLGLGVTNLLQFINDSSRNMFDRRDIRPHYNKLIHANGVCYAGTWKIDRDSPYTGYFANGSEGLLIARASVAGPFIKAGASRAFGIAGKIFPTMDPDEWVWPATFVTVSRLSGYRKKHVLDIEMSNYASVGLNPGAILINRVLFRAMDTRPGYRQLYPISTLGLKRCDRVVTPDLMSLMVQAGTPRVDAKDFRDEIRLRHYPNNQLVFDILVRNFDEPDWIRLGSLTFTDDVVSEGSDKRLHFWIPRDLPNLPKLV